MNDQTTSVVTATVASAETPTLEATLRQKRMALGLISGCHVLNHLQYSITSVIFPVMMTELGFGLVGLGLYFGAIELCRPGAASHLWFSRRFFQTHHHAGDR